MTVFRRESSSSTIPDRVNVLSTDYSLSSLTSALAAQHAAVVVLGPSGLSHHHSITDAAVTARVQRLILIDSGWGPNVQPLPEFATEHSAKKAAWDYAALKASESSGAFTWAGISTGNPIDWVRVIEITSDVSRGLIIPCRH